ALTPGPVLLILLEGEVDLRVHHDEEGEQEHLQHPSQKGGSGLPGLRMRPPPGRRERIPASRDAIPRGNPFRTRFRHRTLPWVDRSGRTLRTPEAPECG